MESIDQDRWARLTDAARRLNVGAAPTTEREAVRLEVERSGRSAATSRGGTWPLIARAGLLALAGVGLAATSFAFLTISEHTPLFGFMEPGYDPTAILASRVAEAVTVASLVAYGIARFVVSGPATRW